MVKVSKTSKEEATPFLAAVRGKRLVWASEVPRHTGLQTDFIKRYCEHTGAKVSARKLYRSNFTFRPMGLLLATSNFAPSFEGQDNDDDGFMRRLRTVRSRAV